MPKFRKKPVIIEARQVTHETINDVFDWLDESDVAAVGNNTEIQIETLEGRMVASLGDWIIRGVQGEFYPCKPDIFEATYERAHEDYCHVPHQWPDPCIRLISGGPCSTTEDR